MKTSTLRTALLATACLLMASGCTATRRYVTHTTSAKETIYSGQAAAMPAPAPTPAPAPPPAEAPVGDAEGAAEGEVAEPAAQPAVAPAPKPMPKPASAGHRTDWIYVAYAEVKETNLFLFKQFKTTSKILRCLISDDNSVVCEEQADPNRVLNPQNK